MAGIEQTIHIKSLSASERALGADVRMELGNIPKRVGKGVGHLAGFSVVAVPSCTAATTSDAIPGEDFLTLVGELRLTVAGVELFGPGVNGRDLRDDVIIRERAISQADPSDEAANQNATVTPTAQVTYRFAGRDEKQRRDGLIDLALLDHRVEPDSALRFTLGSALVGSPTGWTLDSFSSVDLYAIIRYEPEAVRAPLHVVEVQNFSELSGTITPAVPGAVTRLDYAVIRPTPEETGGQDVSAWTGISIRQEARTFPTKDADVLGVAALIDGLRPNQAISGHMPGDLGPGTGLLPLFLPRPEPLAGDLISADVGWDIASRSNHTRCRVLTHQRVAFTPAMEAAAARHQAGRPEAVKTRSLPPGLLPRRLR